MACNSTVSLPDVSFSYQMSRFLQMVRACASGRAGERLFAQTLRDGTTFEAGR